MINKIKELIENNYNIGNIKNIAENNIGRQTHYILETNIGKFFVKILNCKNKNIHKEDEIKICKILKENSINCIPDYINRKDGCFLTQVNEHLYFNIQKFICGNTWKKYEAPDWLLFSSVDIIADIHNILKNIKLSQRNSILKINDVNTFLEKISLLREKFSKINISEKIFILDDLDLRYKILKNQKEIYLNKLTFVNGHSDFTVTQIITNKNKIAGIIDFSETSNIPAIWEIMRFYVNSANECKEKHINISKFKKYLNIYLKKIDLNDYDIKMLFKFNLYYFCQALSVYDKLIETQYSNDYIRRIISRNNTIQCLLNDIEL